MKTHIYKITCLTDMHVGDGESNYNIIDNEVQKDTVLKNVPIIHASSLKGSLRNHFEQIWGADNEKIFEIFGGINKQDIKEGKYKFFTALCVARPLRVSNGLRSHVLATSDDILQHFSDFLKGIGKNEVYDHADNIMIDSNIIEVEGITVKTKNCSKLKQLIGENFVLIENLHDFDLPVRARNKLDENGISENLWYEELVPHKSIFYFIIMEDGDEKLYKDFKNGIETVVQFGGNASIGNGYATVMEVYD